MNHDEQQQIINNAAMIKSIAHPIRLCLVRKLSEADDLTVSYFTSCMSASQSSISQHLGKLKDMGIVSFTKEGNQIKYRLENETLRTIVQTLFKEDL